MTSVKIGKMYRIASVPANRSIGSMSFMVRVEGNRWVDYPCDKTTVVMLDVTPNFYKALFHDGVIGEFYIACDRFLELSK